MNPTTFASAALLALLVATAPARAETAAPTTPAETPASAERSPFGLRAELSFGIGSFKDSTGSIPGRTMDILGIEAMPGYRWNDWFFGPVAEFDLVGQMTEPSTVGNQNLKGHTLLLGVGAAYRYEDFDFMAGIHFLGSHKLSNADPLGTDVSYGKPFGIELQAGYYLCPALSVGVKFEMTSFAEDKLGGVANDVSSDKRQLTDFALAATYHL